MADVSGVLRATREQSGLTLEEISARTRIKVTFLQAIERGDFEQLPGDFFARAFLRTYARELHLSPDDIVHEYDASRRPAEPARPRVAAPAIQPEGDLQHEREVSDRALRAVAPSRWTGWAIAPAAIALLAIVFLFVRPDGGGPAESLAVGTTGLDAAQPAPAAPVPAPTVPKAAPAVLKASEEPDTLLVDIRATGTTWITGYADGQRVVYRLFRAGDEVTVQGAELSFRVGNAGAVDYSINGAPAMAVGGRGDVREFTITRENFQSLLKPSGN